MSVKEIKQNALMTGFERILLIGCYVLYVCKANHGLHCIMQLLFIDLCTGSLYTSDWLVCYCYQMARGDIACQRKL